MTFQNGLKAGGIGAIIAVILNLLGIIPVVGCCTFILTLLLWVGVGVLAGYMVSRAVSTLASPVFSSGQAVLIVIGAVLFYISDIILAAGRFWKPWKYHRISLAFYYSGQLSIALAASYFA